MFLPGLFYPAGRGGAGACFACAPYIRLLADFPQKLTKKWYSVFNLKRMIAIFGLLMVCFLALYTWDARTGHLSRFFSMSGLELTRHVLYPGVWLKDRATDFSDSYLALSDVAKENARLIEELGAARSALMRAQEEQHELARLRDLLDLPSVLPWEKTGSRVIAGKFGPQAALNSIMLNKGFLGGATPGAPVISASGLVGRVRHVSPNSSTVLLITDPSFRVSVIGQQSRVRGILSGAGENNPLLVQYVAPNTNMLPGEFLICSGIDGIMPKGMPAARVSTVLYDKDALFPHITAEPLANLSKLEEVMVLIPPKGAKVDELLYQPFKDIDILPDELELDAIPEDEVDGETGNE